MKIELEVPEKIFNILREAGKLHLLEQWALDGIKARLEAYAAADLIE